jgi:hypothetical protein
MDEHHYEAPLDVPAEQVFEHLSEPANLPPVPAGDGNWRKRWRCSRRARPYGRTTSVPTTRTDGRADPGRAETVGV